MEDSNFKVIGKVYQLPDEFIETDSEGIIHISKKLERKLKGEGLVPDSVGTEGILVLRHLDGNPMGYINFSSKTISSYDKRVDKVLEDLRTPVKSE